MSKSIQQTFGVIGVAFAKGNRQCDKCTGFDENGEPIRCENSAKIAIHRQRKIPEFYCGNHCKDTWVRMAKEGMKR